MIPWRHYLAEPVWAGGVALYVVNRLLLKPWLFHGNSFVHGHFSDALLIPCALPPLLLAYRYLGLRTHDRAPTWGEIGLHLTAWSLFFESIGPAWLHRGTADVWDAVSYAIGAAIAGILWMRRSSAGRVPERVLQ